MKYIFIDRSCVIEKQLVNFSGQAAASNMCAILALHNKWLKNIIFLFTQQKNYTTQIWVVSEKCGYLETRNWHLLRFSFPPVIFIMKKTSLCVKHKVSDSNNPSFAPKYLILHPWSCENWLAFMHDSSNFYELKNFTCYYVPNI